MNRPPDTFNTTGYAQPISGVYKPKSVNDIIEIVRWARTSGIAIYPVSRGLNWGYGSRSPITPNCALVDLSDMNRIRNADQISLDNPVALIEPGVTQAQLYDHLQANCPQLGFNVTGSGRETSILGNALDRGVGYSGPRTDDIFGLEIVDGTGRVFTTGFRRLGESSPLAYNHPYGLGPMLNGLFSQSNLGIVSSACFKLIPRRPKEVAVSIALRRASDLGAFLDELGRLKRDELIHSVAHVGNKARTHATLMFGINSYLEQHCGLRKEALEEEATRALGIVAPYEWTALAAVSGNPAQVRAVLTEVRQRLRKLAQIKVVTDELLDFGYALTHRFRSIPFVRATAAAISAMRPLHALALGVPTDVAIDNLLWKFGQTDLPAIALDKSKCGLIYINPALPSDGALVEKLITNLESIALSHGHTLYVTINIETTTSVVAVINLLFDRSIEVEVKRAHLCSNALLKYIHDEGLEVYRARADMMASVVSRDHPYWQIVASLKSTFDPDGIISPGRYCPTDY